MKPLLLLLPLLVGCSTTNITKLIEAASKDPAHIHLEIRSVYGTVIYDREFPPLAGTTNVQTTVKTITH